MRVSNFAFRVRLHTADRESAAQNRESDVNYMLSIYEDHAAYPGGDKGDVFRRICEAHGALVQELIKAGVFVYGSGLRSPEFSTTVRLGKGKPSLHDGPFAETKEQLGGFYILDLPDLDAAVAWAKRIPTAVASSVEIRPLLTDDM